MTRLLCFFFLLVGVACSGRKAQDPANRPAVKNTSPARLPDMQPGEAVATFAGGCFWSFEEAFTLLRGVRKVVAGYAGGDQTSPTYEQVSTEETGHAESVQVYYNPSVIPYDTLVKAFLYAHDPTTLNRQGPDVGQRYRSIAFYRTPAEKVSLETAIRRFDASDAHLDPVVTKVTPFAAFYPAEVYHQGYYRAHPEEAYVEDFCTPKVEKFRKHMAGKLKPE